jgi:hypothetical protein
MGAAITGIDPGMSGAIAFLAADGSLIDVVDMPVFAVTKRVAGKDRTKNHINTHELGSVIDKHGTASTAVVELVGARPTDGSSQAFQFGFSAGAVHGACGALGMRIETVTPQKWKKHFGLIADKEQARQLAVRRFPAMAHLFKRKMDAGRAEAALIALYHLETSRAAPADVRL